MRRKDAFGYIFGKKRTDVLNLTTILLRIWNKRNFIIKWEVIGIIVGIVICFSIPEEYVTTIKIAPENNNTLSGVFSFNNLMNQFSNKDAFSYRYYPNIINTQSFLYDLLDITIPVTIDTGKETRTVREILDTEYKRPWWEYLFQLPEFMIEHISNSPSEKGTPFMPSEKDLQLIERLKNNITLVIMDRTHYLELEVKMQNPVASAILSDTIASRLIRLITNYRNEKMTSNSFFIERMFDESKLKYEENSQRYADYIDSNQNVIKNMDRLPLQKLSIERTLSFKDYQRNAAMALADKMITHTYSPVFYIVDPPTVAVNSSYPRKLLILSYCMFFFGYIPMLASIFNNHE